MNGRKEVSKMRKPRIAVTPRMVDENIRQAVNNEYLDAIIKAGGIPYMVALHTPIEEILHDFDGLLVTGGEDFEPALFNEETVCEIGKTLYELDLFDLDLIRAFNDANKPILGICRGIQAVNIAFGGTLYQDLFTQYPECRKAGHQQHLMTPPLGRNDFAHGCTTVEGTLLNQMLSKNCQVNTYHHQNIKDLAKGFTASCYSEDGLIEGIENGNNILAVQWHPERLIAHEEHMKIFYWLINQCKK